MTVREFQHKYHNYSAPTQIEAMGEILKIDEIVDDDGTKHKAKQVFFPGQGWAIMLDTAADELEHLGIPEKR